MGQGQFRKIINWEKVSESCEMKSPRQVANFLRRTFRINIKCNTGASFHGEQVKEESEQLEWFILIILEKDNSWSALVVKSFNTRKL